MFAVMHTLVRGDIIIWSGAEADIPAGWHLCDGTAGTINLKDKFIVCAGNTYAVAATGGVINHTHVVTDAGHGHDIPEGSGLMGGDNFDNTAQTNVADVSADTVGNLPPYYALCFIQKV